MKFSLRMTLAAGAMALVFCVPALADHPAYLHALEDLRAARWMIEHRPGGWARTEDEIEAVHQIDAAINEIKLASVFDNKNLDDHPKIDEKADHVGRLHQALEYLNKARADVAQDEDNLFAKGLQQRAYSEIDAAIVATKAAINAPSQASAPSGSHPAYLHALVDLRAARWMIEHRPGSWTRTAYEIEAVKQIDAAINEIKMASIDDGKNIEEHVAVDEKPDLAGRLHDALQYLQKARADVNQEEDSGFAKGLQKRAFLNIDAAIKSVRAAIQS